MKILRFRKPLEPENEKVPQKNNLLDQIENEDDNRWKQIQQLSDLCADPEHLQELMDELHNDPLPGSQPDAHTHPNQQNLIPPLQSESSSSDTFIEPCSAIESISTSVPFIEEPSDLCIEEATKSIGEYNRNILAFSVEELTDLKRCIVNQTHTSICEILQSKPELNTQDPIFIFLLYQFAGDVILLLDSLLERSYSGSTWWNPTFDAFLTQGDKGSIPSTLINANDPLYLNRRKSWLACQSQ